jgi:hypothetical protein
LLGMFLTQIPVLQLIISPNIPSWTPFPKSFIEVSSLYLFICSFIYLIPYVKNLSNVQLSPDSVQSPISPIHPYPTASLAKGVFGSLTGFTRWHKQYSDLGSYIIGMAQAVEDWDWGATHQADNLAGMLFLATQPIFEGRTCQAFDA